MIGGIWKYILYAKYLQAKPVKLQLLNLLYYLSRQLLVQQLDILR